MRRWILLLAFVLLPGIAAAQTTSVSGTITDAGAVIWKNGTYTFTFTPSPNNPTANYFQNGVPFNKFTTISGSLDATGSLTSVAVPDNLTITPSGSTWATKVCSASTASNGCFTTQLTITGASQSITSSVVPPAIILDLTNPPPGGASAYIDGEIIGARVGSQYFNLTDSTIHVCTFPLCTWVAVGAASSPVVPGGTSIQAQFNNGGSFGGSPCISLNNLVTGSINQDCDTHFKGPNPYVDITRFGAVTCNPNTTPCAAGITASISSGTNTATISSASTFSNGNGVVIYGAGAATTLTVPTGLAVTNVVARMGTGTGITVPGAPGASTRCYVIIARTRGGGYTAASSEVCNNSSQASLGAVSVNLSSCSRATTTVTCTTSSSIPIPSNFGVNQPEIYIGGSITDASFRGWRAATTSVDSTHFTFVDDSINTANGATASSTGGTVTFYVANHLSWNAVTGAWLYYIYEGASSAETLIGVSRPQNGAIGVTDTTFDDFGTGLMSNFQFPAWIPTTPPVAGANDNLSTTITAGAGTTTLTLFNNAGATVSGVGIRLDSGPGIVAAATVAAGNGGVIYIPNDQTGNAFVINNFCDLTSLSLLAFLQNNRLLLHETLALPATGLRWAGDRLAGSGTGGFGGANTWANYPKIITQEAVPGIYVNSGGSFSFDGVQFHSLVSNGVLEMLSESGFNISFTNVRFTTGTTSSDEIGFGLILRGTAGQSAAGIVMDRVSLSSGDVGDGTSHNTPFYCNNCGDLAIREAYIINRGIIFNGNSAGQFSRIEDVHYNGGGTPLVSVFNTNGFQLGWPGKPVIMDTVGHPCVSIFGGGNTQIYSYGCAPSGFSFAAPSVTGSVQSLIEGGGNLGSFNNSLTRTFSPTIEFNGTRDVVLNVAGPGGISVNPAGSAIFVSDSAPTAPTCSVSAGGSVAVGSWTIKLQVVWGNGKGGTLSNASTTCTTSSGNQTITINWTIPTITPGFTGFNIYASNGGGYAGLAGNPFSASTTSFVWNNSNQLGFGLPNSIPLGGPTMLLPGTQGISTPALITTNCSSSAAPAVCGSSIAGSVVIAAGATTVTVNTTAVTANSQIFIQPDASLGTKLSVTCNVTGATLDAEPWVSARTGGTSFTITVNAAPAVNPECISYLIVN